MPHKIQTGFTTIFIIILLVIVLLGVALYFLKPWNKFNLPSSPKASSTDIGAKIYDQTKNPVSKLPETNPFSKVNPFKGVYKNPFE